MRRASIGITLVACLALSGCATVFLEPFSRGMGALGGGGHGGATRPPKVYSGVRFWFHTLGKGELYWIPVFPVALVDFPLSFIADTIILPYTIAVNVDRTPPAPSPVKGKPKPAPR